jgi:hypothetical protein
MLFFALRRGALIARSSCLKCIDKVKANVKTIGMNVTSLRYIALGETIIDLPHDTLSRYGRVEPAKSKDKV